MTVVMTLLPGSLFYFLVITILAVGTIGNLLTLLVLQRKAYTGKSFAIILRSLAVADTVALWIEPDAVIDYSHVNFPTPVGWTLWGWFIDWVYISSSWTIILVTIERLIGIYNPYMAKVWVTGRRAIWAVLIMWVVFGVLIASYVFAFCLDDTESDFCISDQNQKQIFKLNMFLVLYSVLPSVILVICNILIIIKLQVASDHRQEMSTVASAAKQDEDTITLMLMTNSFMFAMFTVPYSVCNLILIPIGDKNQYYGNYLFYEVTDFCHVLERVNHAINFELYCVSGAMFRREMKLMFKDAVSWMNPVRLCPSPRSSRALTSQTIETEFVS